MQETWVLFLGFPGVSAGRGSACNVGDLGSIRWENQVAESRAGFSQCGKRDRLPALVFLVFPGSSAGKESICNVGDLGSIPGLGRFPGEGNTTHSSILAWSLWGCKELDTTEQLSLFHLY